VDVREVRGEMVDLFDLLDALDVFNKPTQTPKNNRNQQKTIN